MTATEYRIHVFMQTVHKDMSKKEIVEEVGMGYFEADLTAAFDNMRTTGRIAKTKSKKFVLLDSPHGRARSLAGAVVA